MYDREELAELNVSLSLPLVNKIKTIKYLLAL